MTERGERQAKKIGDATIDRISLEQSLRDAEAANARVIQLTQQLLKREEQIKKLGFEIVELKRILTPRQRAEHAIRQNPVLLPAARKAKAALNSLIPSAPDEEMQ